MRGAATGLILVLAMGCEGFLEVGPSGPRGSRRPDVDPGSGACVEADVPAPEPLRRISSEQYARVVRDLVPEPLGSRLLALSSFPETRIERGFASDAAANTVSTVESNAIEDNAEAMASHILAEADTAIPLLAGCVSAGFDDADLDTCFPTFLSRFGARAYRRPLTEGEQRVLTGLYERIGASQGARAGLAAVVQVFLQAPALLYRTERGAGLDDRGALRLTSYEVATRLSFFLRGSIPDDALMAAAEGDRLTDPAEVESQARRLASEAPFVDVMAELHRDWLGAYTIAHDRRDHPLFSDVTQAALADEMRRYTQMVLEGDGRFATLVGSARLPIAPELAEIYGVSEASGAAMEVPHRRGILSLASVLASHAHEEHSLPIQRGAFLREAVLCGGSLTLPAGVDVAAEVAATADLPTARQRLSSLTERSDCAGCHTQINPIGLGIENYDHLGAWRELENGVEIDPSGELAVGTLRGSFATPEALFELIAASPEARDCYATQMYRFAMGREETTEDACTLRQIRQRFAESEGDIRELAIAITVSRPFMTRHPAEER